MPFDPCASASTYLYAQCKYLHVSIHERWYYQKIPARLHISLCIIDVFPSSFYPGPAVPWAPKCLANTPQMSPKCSSSGSQMLSAWLHIGPMYPKWVSDRARSCIKSYTRVGKNPISLNSYTCVGKNLTRVGKILHACVRVCNLP